MKLCSRNLNYLIILGAALLYASVFMYEFTADRNHANLQTVLCNVRNYTCNFFYHMTGVGRILHVLHVIYAVASVVLHTWLHSVLCCHLSQDMEGVLHLHQSSFKENG